VSEFAAMPRLAHIGILVRHLADAVSLYHRLGLPESGRETFDQENILIAFVPVEETRIELMEPLAATDPLDRFLATRGEGIHHLAFEVPDIERALARARSAGARLIDESPRRGAHDTRVAFIHPSSAHGVLIELVEKNSP
jgi:methylmalonyl-CoA/ethylmalonyl-CoA epimerase